MYPTKVKMKQAPTFKRVFEHTDNLAARDWKTHNSETFGEVQGQYQNSQKHGKRASREMAKLMELARQEPAEEPKRMTFATTNRADYVEQELKGLVYGARVMKTQDGGAVRRDRDFLVESGIMRPIDADRVVGDNHDQAGSRTSPSRCTPRPSRGVIATRASPPSTGARCPPSRGTATSASPSRTTPRPCRSSLGAAHGAGGRQGRGQ